MSRSAVWGLYALLVLVWQADEDPPAVPRFRELAHEGQKSTRLWPE